MSSVPKPSRRVRQHRPARQLGFSLVEIMVGLIIGMIAVIVVMQIFLSSEGNKRNTTGGNDAQINGAIALYQLERDLRSAGHDISNYGVLGCNVTFTPSSESSAVTIPLAAITINPATSQVPAGDSNTDTLLVISGNSNGSSEGDLLTTTSTSTNYVVATVAAFTTGDLLLGQAATRPSTCTLNLSPITGISGSTLTVTNGTSGLASGSTIYNLGQTLTARAYAIRNGNLTVCDYTQYNCGTASYVSTLNSTVWLPIASNMLSLRAQYGRDTTNVSTSAMDGAIDTYDQITPGSASDTSGLNIYCAWNRVLATRVVLVARSAQYDKTGPTTTTPTWAGTTVSTAAPTNPTSVPINLSSTAMSGSTSMWQNYRYKTLQTVIPLRNTLWQGSQTSAEGGTGGC